MSAERMEVTAYQIEKTLGKAKKAQTEKALGEAKIVRTEKAKTN